MKIDFEEVKQFRIVAGTSHILNDPFLIIMSFFI